MLLHAEEIEEAVISALLIESSAIVRVVRTIRPEMFYVSNYQTIYAAIERMFNAGEKIDLLTVKEELGKAGKLDEVGGPYALAVIAGKLASSAHLERHAQILLDKYLRRVFTVELNKILAKAQDETFATEEVLADIHKMTDNVEKECLWTQELRDMPELMEDTLAQAEKRRKLNINGLTGIPTGLTELDKLTSGLQPGELVLIAARPSVGKTAFALNLAKAAARSGSHVVVYSIEMPGERLGDRWLLSETRINAEQWKSGQIGDREMEQAKTAAQNLSQLPLHIDDNANIGMDHIRASARMLHSKGQCGCIIVDYLQLSKMRPDKENRNREQEVAQAARKAKQIARELEIPVVLLSQLNRESENRPYKKPALADLRESGSIEQDADIVMLLYRPAMAGLKTDKDTDFPTENMGVAIVAKHRNGKTKNIYFGHSDDLTVITDYEPPQSWVLKQR